MGGVGGWGWAEFLFGEAVDDGEGDADLLVCVEEVEGGEVEDAEGVGVSDVVVVGFEGELFELEESSVEEAGPVGGEEGGLVGAVGSDPGGDGGVCDVELLCDVSEGASVVAEGVGFGDFGAVLEVLEFLDGVGSVGGLVGGLVGHGVFLLGGWWWWSGVEVPEGCVGFEAGGHADDDGFDALVVVVVGGFGLDGGAGAVFVHAVECGEGEADFSVGVEDGAGGFVEELDGFGVLGDVLFGVELELFELLELLGEFVAPGWGEELVGSCFGLFDPLGDGGGCGVELFGDVSEGEALCAEGVCFDGFGAVLEVGELGVVGHGVGFLSCIELVC